MLTLWDWAAAYSGEFPSTVFIKAVFLCQSHILFTTGRSTLFSWCTCASMAQLTGANCVMGINGPIYVLTDMLGMMQQNTNLRALPVTVGVTGNLHNEEY